MRIILLNPTDFQIGKVLEAYYARTKHGIRGHARWLYEKVIFDPLSVIIGVEDDLGGLCALFVVRLENRDEAIILFAWSRLSKSAPLIVKMLFDTLRKMGVAKVYASLFSTRRRAEALARLLKGKVSGYIVEVDL